MPVLLVAPFSKEHAVKVGDHFNVIQATDMNREVHDLRPAVLVAGAQVAEVVEGAEDVELGIRLSLLLDDDFVLPRSVGRAGPHVLHGPAHRIALPSWAVVGALTFVTVRSGGGVKLIVNGDETVMLSVPLP